ncbi:hypothetical protein C1646_708944 [Rhizophagus diaphanus]|nr:hypothetical protein C1646_708944 [Rhizophagus diaphanus] [Rhizophagus sp. MUCL 43196]
MKFNYSFLLFLATLFAVGSSEDYLVRIRSEQNRNLYWAVDRDWIILNPGSGDLWFVSSDDDGVTTFTTYDGDRAVTYNGRDKWITLNDTSQGVRDSQYFKLDRKFSYKFPISIQPIGERTLFVDGKPGPVSTTHQWLTAELVKQKWDFLPVS